MMSDEQLFLAIVDSQSFKRAAEQLKTSTSAVSRQLQRLEQKLGVQLLHRTTRNLAVTEPGQVYYASCRRIEDEKRTTQRQLHGLTQNPAGRLQITATASFTYAHLVPVLEAFTLQYPEIDVQLTVSDRQMDLIDEGIDLAIRGGYLKDSRLKSRRLFQSHLAFCAAPAYLERCGRPTRLDQLADHQFIHTGHLPNIEKRQREKQPDLDLGKLRKKLEVNDVMSAYWAVKRGLGITVLPAYLIEADVRSGALELLLPDAISMPHNVYLLFPAATFMPTRTRLLMDRLLARFQGPNP